MLSEEFLENLDGMFPEELREYAQRLRGVECNTGQDERTRSLLVDYAEYRADAMDARASGRIADALSMEGMCQLFYERLPEYARW